jgi:hypothetical protein
VARHSSAFSLGGKLRSPETIRDRSLLVAIWPLAILFLTLNTEAGDRSPRASPAAEPACADRAAARVGPPTVSPEHHSGPKVSVDSQHYDFGRSEVGVPGQHAFVFTNTGDEPLLLARGSSTCGCCTCVCTVRLPDDAVAPGRSAPVTLQWKSKLYVGAFRQTATILTNDSGRGELTLSVGGRFTGPVGTVPSQVTFGSVRTGQTAMREVHLYNYLPESLDITGYELSNPQIADSFDIGWSPLSPEQVKHEGDARNGYLLRIVVRPGLPAGPFRQEIVLRTNSKSARPVTIPVEGKIVTDLSIAGRGWNAQTGVLTIGNVQRSEGADWLLLILVRGPHAKHVRLRPIASVPDWLAVELGPTQYKEVAGISLTRIKIRIPPGSDPSMHLGGGQGTPGRITIQTEPAVLPDLTFQVRFAVSE